MPIPEPITMARGRDYANRPDTRFARAPGSSYTEAKWLEVRGEGWRNDRCPPQLHDLLTLCLPTFL